MVGIPDGLGAFRHGHDFTLFMNHEIAAARPGIVRAHGSNGAFVSRWTIDRRTLAVQKLEDHTQSPSDVHLWNSSLHQYVRGTRLFRLPTGARADRPTGGPADVES